MALDLSKPYYKNLVKSTLFARSTAVDVFGKYVIILFAIFLAVYPMIGDGYAQFSEDFNVDGVFNFVSNIVASLSELVDKLQG